MAALTHADDQEFHWTMDAGLGPLIHHVLGYALDEVPKDRHNKLRAADLTARVLHETRVETTLRLLEACQARGISVTLLKGISTSEDLYPLAHLRRMGDVDVLVHRELQPIVEEIARTVGFEYGGDAPLETLQHGVPMVHCRSGVWLEVHRSLFPTDSVLGVSRCFGAENVAFHTKPSDFRGRPVGRLSAEMQLAYIATYWMRDIVHDGVHPGCVMALFDAVYLLRGRPDLLIGDSMPDWIDNDVARASLQVMLGYLERRTGLRFSKIPAPSSWSWRVGPAQSRAIKFMLDRYLIGGLPWPWRVPVPVPGRYSLIRQALKRSGFAAPATLDW